MIGEIPSDGLGNLISEFRKYRLRTNWSLLRRTGSNSLALQLVELFDVGFELSQLLSMNIHHVARLVEAVLNIAVQG